MSKYVVYKHTFPNEKVYIGITKQSVNKRWLNGFGYITQRLMWSAIQKYGWENIKHEILFDNLTNEEAQEYEKETIKKYRSNKSKYGYNLTTGGNGTNLKYPTAKQISKMAKSKVGKKYSPETRQRMSNAHKAEKAYWYNKHLSEQTKQKISMALKDKKSWNKGLKLDTNKGALHFNAKPVRQFNLNGKFIDRYETIAEASKSVKINRNCIDNCLKNISKTAGGYIWKYEVLKCQ